MTETLSGTASRSSARPASRRRRKHGRTRVAVLGCQIALLAALILAWQYLPQIGALQRFGHFFDPYFISSPTRIWTKLLDLFSGRNGNPAIWEYLWPTLWSSVAGTAIGMSLGAVAGLVLSNFDFASRVLRPFIVAFNAIPRIALVPIVILLFGPTVKASVVVAVLVVFFVAFFNAYEGGVNVPVELVHNARLLGAGELAVVRHVRAPYVLAWTLAVLPLGTTFAIISVVTAEILSGSKGIGRLLSQATQTADSTLTFALIVVLSVMSVVVLAIAEALKRRILHWWNPGH
jgi:NitT/TauT family transport system permease protein